VLHIFHLRIKPAIPKAIAGRFESVAHFIDWEIRTFDIDETCRVGQFTLYAFDAFLRDVFVPLCAGGTICIPDSREMILDTASLVTWIDETPISLIHCVPSPIQDDSQSGIEAGILQPSETCNAGLGEKLFPGDVKKWLDLYGERIQLVNFYGPTETTMIKFSIRSRALTWIVSRYLSVNRWRCPSNSRRSGRLRTCPPSSVGEIYIRTPYRSLGYYNAPDMTGQFFVQNPFNDDPHDIVYKTGDLARVQADGNFEFLGRKDHQVKIRAFASRAW